MSTQGDAGPGGRAAADFAGETARLYRSHRRDLPADQARSLAGELRLRAEDVVVDLGCGTGQLAVPLRRHCAGVVAVDPEPAMLAGLRDRAEPGVLCLLGSDDDLPVLGEWLTGAGAVVVGNALHWMDEPVAIAACAGVLRPGGAVGVVTQGPPLWLGSGRWQQLVREVLEEEFGPVRDTCGSDAAALERRVGTARGLGLEAHAVAWTAAHAVDVDWVLGHLGSALPAGALDAGRADGPAGRIRERLTGTGPFVEVVTTTAVIGRRRDG